MKVDTFNTLIPPPISPEDKKVNRVRVYVMEINSDFSCIDVTPCTVQDPTWVNYDVDSHQVQLDKPLLLDTDPNYAHIHFPWQRNCVLTSLINVMNQYGGSVDNNFSLVKMILNGVCRKYGELTNDEAGSEDFLKTFCYP